MLYLTTNQIYRSECNHRFPKKNKKKSITFTFALRGLLLSVANIVCEKCFCTIFLFLFLSVISHVIELDELWFPIIF